MNCPKCQTEMEEVIFAAFGRGFRCPKCKHDILMGDEDDE